MSTITYTDETRLDLSDDIEFSQSITRRQELDEMIEAYRRLVEERKAIDAKIVARLGNATSAIAANGDIVSVRTVNRKEYTVKPTSWKVVKVRHTAKVFHLPIKPEG